MEKMKRWFSFIVVTVSLVATLTFAQTTDQVASRKVALESELKLVEQQIAAQTKLLQITQQQGASLKRDVDILNGQISRAKLVIKQHQLEIVRLGGDIKQKSGTITELTGKIATIKVSLAELLRKRRNAEENTIVELLFEKDTLANLFNEADSYQYLEDSIHQAFTEMRTTKANTESAKVVLEDKQQAEIDARQGIETEKRLIEKKEVEKKQLLSITKNKETNYKNVLTERQRKAAQIRVALFALRDTAAIPFGKALDYATKASQKTGVRPALILAILTQESNLGENQGSCILSSLETGDGVGKNTGTPFEKVMKAPRDTVPFQSITSRLGRDWKLTPVSCPPGARYVPNRGYGGAMGPSQFIPSTWELFKNRIGQLVGLTGDKVDPWNPEQAIMATALYLSDLGASSGRYTAEIAAACKYYGTGGASCSYGTQVLAKASNIQLNMIDPLQNN
jgi:membrane-bound lytic murein transglycosylase B